MGCSGCGDNGPTMAFDVMNDDGLVPMEYVGTRTAAVTFWANGRAYRGGLDRTHRFARVRPADVARLQATGSWRRAADWTPDLDVVLPTRGRPVELARCLDSLVATAPDIRVVILADEDDAPTLAAIDDYRGRLTIDVDVMAPGNRAGAKWNRGAQLARGNTLVFAADDLVFEGDWLARTIAGLKRFPDGSALVGFDELAGSPHPLHFAVTKRLLTEVNGGALSVPHYQSWFMDVELCDKARAHARYIANSGAIVQHLHPIHGSAPVDAMHQNGFIANQHRDNYIYQRRKAAGFPIDWTPFVQDGTPTTQIVPTRSWAAGFVAPIEDVWTTGLVAAVGTTEAPKAATKRTGRKKVAA